jgi:tight adherence protein C
MLEIIDTTTVAVFIGAISMVLLLFMLVTQRKSRLESRLRELANEDAGIPQVEPVDSVVQLARTALPRMGTPFLPKDEEERTRLQTRLIHAGLYSKQAPVIFLGVKVLLMVAPAVIGLALGLVGLFPIGYGVLVGALLGAFGMIGPSFWLDRRKAARQSNFRRALPDALDVLVICLEGGLSIPGAIRRVGTELRTAHPQLAAEFTIVQREIQLGQSVGEALRRFSDRADLEEVRSLASVIMQSERFGASMVKALQTHAETLRARRLQYAEEMAQKAATKVLFPTILCILPGVFIVILGPAAIQIVATLSKLTR